MMCTWLLYWVSFTSICITTCAVNLVPGRAVLKATSTGLVSKREEPSDFVALKVGPRKQAVWYYSGVIRNPLTGAEVVGIEGVETVRALKQSKVAPSNDKGGCDEQDCGYLTKKLFAYVDVKNRSELIEKFRVRHHSPLRPVTPVKTYAEKVILSTEQDGSIHARIEWPGSGRVMKTSKISISKAPEVSWLAGKLGRKKLNVVNFMSAAVNSDPRKVDKLSFLRRWVSLSPTSAARSGGRSQEYYTIASGFTGQQNELTFKTATATPDTQRSNERGTSINAKDSRKETRPSDEPNKSEASNQMTAGKNGRVWPAVPWTAMPRVFEGSKMKYVKPEAVISYRRYGEGPPWYAVGKACVVEMTGYRFPHSRCLPKHVRDLVQRVDPGFFDTHFIGVDGTDEPVSPASGSKTSTISGLLKGANKDGVLDMKWFARQSDPADAYKPWYVSVGGALRSGYERLHK
jgi:hypothetical protein